MKNFIAAFVAGFLCLYWSNVSWMILPWHKTTIHSFKNDQVVQTAILENISSSGKAVYALPAFHGKKEAPKSPQLINEDGTILRAFVAVVPQAPNGFSPIKLAYEFGYDFLIALLIAFLISWANLVSFGSILAFTLVIGFISSVSTNLPNWNWWGFASDYVLVGMADGMVYSLIIGLVLALMLKKKA
jgi:hypothetical protein